MSHIKTILISFPLIIVILFIGLQIPSNSLAKNGKSPTFPHTDTQILSSDTGKKKSSSSSSFQGTTATLTAKVMVYCCEEGRLKTKKMKLSDLQSSKSCASVSSKVKVFCGFCSKGGSVTPVSNPSQKKSCDKGGKLYATNSLAKSNSGWCWQGGKVFSVNDKKQCKTKLYATQAKAKKASQLAVKKGFCNVGGKTLANLTERQCKNKRKGVFFATRALATKDLMRVKRLVKKQKKHKQPTQQILFHTKKIGRSSGKATELTRKGFQAKPPELKTDPPESIPAILERGIYIRQPTGGEFHRMDTLHISYSFTREIEDDIVVILHLMNRDNPSFSLELQRVPVDRGETFHWREIQEFDWSIPLSVGYGTYYIRAEAGELYGESNNFSIVENTSLSDSRLHGLQVNLLPDKPQYNYGERVSLQIRPDSGARLDSSGDFSIFMHLREDTSARRTLSSWYELEQGSGSYDEARDTWTVPVTLPSGTGSYSSGTWVISVDEAIAPWGQSHGFTLVSKSGTGWTPGRGLSVEEVTGDGGSSALRGIGIIYPNGGERLVSCCGESYTFQWYHWEDSPPPDVLIELLNEDAVLRSWPVGSGDISYDESSKICSATINLGGSGYETSPPGDNYNIRITSGEYSDEGGTFAIIGPFVIDGPYNLEDRRVSTLYYFNRYSIRWSMHTRIGGTFNFYLIRGGRVEDRDIFLGSAEAGLGRFSFWAPIGSGDQILAAAAGSSSTYSLSREFRYRQGSVRPTAPSSRDRWRNGEIHHIRWESEHIPVYLPYSPSEKVSLSIYLLGGPYRERNLLIRNYPMDSGSYRWRVAYGPSLTFGEPDVIEGVSGRDVPNMGGVPDTHPPGTYRIVLEVEQMGMIVMGEEFRIE